MNTKDILRYGHHTFLGTLDGLPHTVWDTPNVCGKWSVKNIVAHLASYELLLVDVIHQLLGADELTPTLDQLLDLGPYGFNDVEVDARLDNPAAEQMAEFQEAYERVMALIPRISPEKCREVGALPWYGVEYDFDDFIVYSFYGHKREHSAQVAVFRDQFIAG